MAEIKFVNFQEALVWLENEPMDPITHRLIHLSIFHLIARAHSEGDWPETQWDVQYFVSLMKRVFENHDDLKRILAGEIVGQFFNEDAADSST